MAVPIHLWICHHREFVEVFRWCYSSCNSCTLTKGSVFIPENYLPWRSGCCGWCRSAGQSLIYDNILIYMCCCRCCCSHIQGTTWRPYTSYVPAPSGPLVQSPLMLSPYASSTPVSVLSQSNMQVLQQPASQQQLELLGQQAGQPPLQQMQVAQSTQPAQTVYPASLPLGPQPSSGNFNRSQLARLSSRSVESGRTHMSLGSLGSGGPGGVMAALHARIGSMDSTGSPRGNLYGRRLSCDNGIDYGSGGSQSPISLSRRSSKRGSYRARQLACELDVADSRFQQPKWPGQASAPESGDNSPTGTGTFIRTASRRHGDPTFGSSETSPAGMISRHSTRRYTRATYVPPNPFQVQGVYTAYCISPRR